MTFETPDPDFEKAVRESFARQTFMATLGAELETVEPGRVVIGFAMKNGLLQQHGFLHAGVPTTCVDSACGYAALTLAPLGSEVLTSEFKVHFLRPASGRMFVATGTVLKPGRIMTVCEGEVTDAETGSLIAKMTATMVLRPAPGVLQG